MNMMKTGAFGSKSEQGNSPHQEPEHDRAGAGDRDDWFCKASISSNFLLKHLEQV